MNALTDILREREPILRVQDVSVRYGKVAALEALELDIYAGELVGVIGPNGAGKTSFIKALCGRLDPIGTISVSGDSLKRGADRRKHIALVPQDIGLYPHMTARENLLVMARMMGLSHRHSKAAADEALSAVEMDAKSGTRVSQLSGGMKRRINVAAAIMHNPSLVIFDEPTAGVDVPARDTVHRLARKLATEGKAVILVTHELEQAEALCDKVLLLCGGKRLAFEPPARVLERSFQGQREVMVRFASRPTEDVLHAMRPFEFKPGELDTIWTAMTQASEVSFVSAFMTALRGGNENIREISVRKPGLSALMRRIEATGSLYGTTLQ